MVDRDIDPIDTVHNVQGLSHISKSVDREEQRKKKKQRKDREALDYRNIDEKLEEELGDEEREVLADEDMDHINFRA